jgi:N-acylglucosamine 2-epimerase
MARQLMLTLDDPQGPEYYRDFYQTCLLNDVIPFWLKNGIDRDFGGVFTALDRDGSLLDSDKSVWFQGRAGWMFATLFRTVEARPEWFTAAQSCADFSLKHCHSESGKMWFTVTRDGQPLRMRRYVFSEAFAAINYAAVAKITGMGDYRQASMRAFEVYLRYSFEPGLMQPKFETTRPTKGIGPLMIAIVTAQELRSLFGNGIVSNKTFTEWIDWCIAEIERDFLKPEFEALMESVGLNGEVLDHIDARTLNPGHAIECAWFLMEEGRFRNDPRLISLGVKILDWMWSRGWDKQFGGLLYFVDLLGKPVQEYWHDMKFWWPHCEAVIATLLAWKLTGDKKYATMHADVHRWSFEHFPDRQHGEWYGYLHRDGTVSQTAKGNMFKGPFHLPRMLWMCMQATT